MRLRESQNARLATLAFLFSVVIVFVWVPLDVGSGVLEKVRRSVQIGDSLAPVLAALVIALGSVLLLLNHKSDLATNTLRAKNLHYMLMLAALFCIVFILMRWTGPLLTLLFGPDGTPYRLLRDTQPWKYLGYAVGGIVLIAGLISLVEKRLTATAIIIAIVAVMAIIVFYDLPFDDLLLPPNGDV